VLIGAIYHANAERLAIPNRKNIEIRSRLKVSSRSPCRFDPGPRHHRSRLHQSMNAMSPPVEPASAARQVESAVSVASSRSEAVTLVLRDMITRGDFAAGFHLQETPLAERMGVSRTPIREALATLAKEGLLEPGPRRGYKVRTFSIEEIVDAYEMRAALEGTACRLLAERGLSEEQIRTVRNLLDAGDQLIERGRFTTVEHEPWGEMNIALHQFFVDATGNALLKGFVQQTGHVPLAGPRDVHWYRLDQENFTLMQQAHRDHHEILNAIIKRQSGRAEARMREHIHLSRDLVWSRFRQQTVGFDAATISRPNQQDLTR
jgi:GntR family transcriptional regulator of vanillate catabolism